uniref:DUF1977 domain-containing protein n=1 Tax=Sus scrofa TaxID=9823 RepID=A0A8D1FPM3_PIG
MRLVPPKLSKPSAQRMQYSATQRKGSSMTSSVMTRARQPDRAMGMGTSIVALRPTSPLKTSSTCFLEVASHLVTSMSTATAACATHTIKGRTAGRTRVTSVGHVHKRVTDHLNVVYYVADTFSEEYTGSSLKMVERNVEDDYIANLRNNCWKEKQQKEGLLYRARYFGDTDMYHKAQKMGTPSCNRLSETMKSLENFW